MEPILSKSWLINFRWSLLALALTVCCFSDFFGLDRNIYNSVFIFIITIPISNFFLSINKKISSNEYSLLLLLVFDIILISLILNSSGGATNPFSILFLVYVVFSSILLKPTSTLFIVIISIASFGILLKNVPEHHMHNSSDYFNHLNGMWIAYSLVAIVCSFTISTLANLLKNNLKRTQELINSQLRLKSLTTLSAGAAHELRTPLNTISLCIDDLKFLLSKDNKKINSQLNTISEQILRCIQIIKDLSLKSGEIEGETYAPVFLRTLISDLIVDFNRDIKIEEFSSVLDNKILIPKQSILKAIRSLIQNSIESCENPTIKINCFLTQNLLTVQVKDNGSGIAPEIKSRIGEPFITSKPPGKGMGLGIFIAKLTANCYGGDLTFSTNELSGTTASLTLTIKNSC